MTINSTMQKIENDFSKIKTAAEKAVVQLTDENTWASRTKAGEIKDAVQRLGLLIIQRYSLGKPSVGACTEQLDPDQVKNQEDGCLNDLDAMLDCKVSVLRQWTSHGDSTYGVPDVECEAYRPQSSIRKALNASRNNIFFLFDWTIGPAWGKSNTLIRFEQEVFPRRS